MNERRTGFPGMGGMGRGRGGGHGRGFGRGCERAEGPFRRNGIRMTLTRRVIIEALDDADGFLSAEDLYMLVRDEYPGIGVATVYRTLQLLEDLAMVHRIETGDGRARYAMNREPSESGEVPGNEVILICDRCGEIIRQPGAEAKMLPLFEELSRGAEKEHRFRTGRRTLQIHGTCAACSGAAGAEKGD